MRDILLTLVIFGAIPFVLKRPYIGACLMAWVGFMNPHTQAWGFAKSMPFAAIAVFFTAVAIAMNRDKVKFKINPTFILVYVFLVWGAICTANAFFVDDAMNELTRFTKIQLCILLTILVITDSYKIKALVWTVAFSLAFYGVKGALFVAQTGGAYRVWGPPKTFIGGNNEIGLALLMTVPLLYFCFLQAKRKSIKWLVLGVIGGCVISIIFTYSRGAFLGLVCMLLFLWWKSDRKVLLGAIGAALIIFAVPFIPQSVYERLETIDNYQEDSSALGRLNSWELAFNMANDRITGGGYNHTSDLTSQLYAPDPTRVNDAHSIYFEVLGEMGWIGFLLFAAIHITNWFAASKVIRDNRDYPERKWVVDLAKMIQVSMIAYYSGGAFLGLAYWDMPYYLMLFTLLLSKVIPEEARLEQLGSRDVATEDREIDTNPARDLAMAAGVNMQHNREVNSGITATANVNKAKSADSGNQDSPMRPPPSKETVKKGKGLSDGQVTKKISGKGLTDSTKRIKGKGL